jgi:hypothetical protein
MAIRRWLGSDQNFTPGAKASAYGFALGTMSKQSTRWCLALVLCQALAANGAIAQSELEIDQSVLEIAQSVLEIDQSVLEEDPSESLSEQGVSVTAPRGSEPLMEEVVVVAVERCGPWPIRHSLIERCDYPELTREALEQTRALRAEASHICLRCDAGICQPNLDGKSRESKFVCKKVFWTPKKVGRVSRATDDDGDLSVTFSYSVTTRGRVSDITITTLDAALSPDAVLALIRAGAQRTRFEPLTIDGQLHEIVGITDSYLLDHLMWLGVPP